MRICIVYDCLYPSTVGGAERWYRSLAEALAAGGHEVTYLTMRQWEGDPPRIPAVAVVAVAPRMELYTASGRRRIAPALRFGLGVLGHLARHGRRYDVVHSSSLPYFSLLAAGALRRARGYRLVVDWVELWSRAYWNEYLGRVGGAVGHAVVRRCLRIPQDALCYSALVEARLRQGGLNGRIVRLAGLRTPPEVRESALQPEPAVVYAGRHIPEKQVPALVPAIEVARRDLPGLRCTIYGEGPERERVRRLITERGLGNVVSAPGFVPVDEVEEAIGRALALVLPSRREGYGLVVVEAAAQGTPSVVVAGDDNAAVELVEDGVNGFVTGSASAADLAEAIVKIARAGPALRESTLAWFRRNEDRFSLERSLEIVERFYAATP